MSEICANVNIFKLLTCCWISLNRFWSNDLGQQNCNTELFDKIYQKFSFQIYHGITPICVHASATMELISAYCADSLIVKILCVTHRHTHRSQEAAAMDEMLHHSLATKLHSYTSQYRSTAVCVSVCVSGWQTEPPTMLYLTNHTARAWGRALSVCPWFPFSSVWCTSHLSICTWSCSISNSCSHSVSLSVWFLPPQLSPSPRPCSVISLMFGQPTWLSISLYVVLSHSHSPLNKISSSLHLHLPRSFPPSTLSSPLCQKGNKSLLVYLGDNQRQIVCFRGMSFCLCTYMCIVHVCVSICVLLSQAINHSDLSTKSS